MSTNENLKKIKIISLTQEYTYNGTTNLVKHQMLLSIELVQVVSSTL